VEDENYQINRFGSSSSPLKKLRQLFDAWVRRLPSIGQDGKDSLQENHNSEPVSTETAVSDAVFLGWQKTSSGEKIALYNIIAKEHPLYRSTVTEQTLRKQNLKIPRTPSTSSVEERFDDEE
jgi:hypothetical protein